MVLHCVYWGWQEELASFTAVVRQSRAGSQRGVLLVDLSLPGQLLGTNMDEYWPSNSQVQRVKKRERESWDHYGLKARKSKISFALSSFL